MKKIFLFGAGEIAERYTRFLAHIPVEIEGYVDNDKNKWGCEFFDRKIYAPVTLLHAKSSFILIACAAIEEVTKQLTKMNLIERVVSFCQILEFYSPFLLNSVTTSIKCHVNVENSYLKNYMRNTLSNRTIVIDNFYGSWGGAEDWCHIVASSLAKKSNVLLIEKKEQPEIKELERNILHIDTDGKDTYQIYTELTKLLMQMKPFILFNVWNLELLWAATTIKWTYPEEVNIVSSILIEGKYAKWAEWDKVTDKYICISSKIQEGLVESYKIKREKTYYFYPFVEENRIINRKYSIDSAEPIKIGYPCRLVKEQKRADLIPEFISYLEMKKINYTLNIIGDGECRKEIEEYVKKNQLDGKVKIHGKLSRAELIFFLGNQDIYLNFSEYEGTSLTMLEAMASGCVPIVTNVSGVSDFIDSNVNGLIADIGDLGKIAEYIAYLDQNRNLLSKYGNICMDIVNERCRIDKYMNNIENMIESLGKG